MTLCMTKQLRYHFYPIILECWYLLSAFFFFWMIKLKDRAISDNFSSSIYDEIEKCQKNYENAFVCFPLWWIFVVLFISKSRTEQNIFLFFFSYFFSSHKSHQSPSLIVFYLFSFFVHHCRRYYFLFLTWFLCSWFQMLWFKFNRHSCWSGDTWSPLLSCENLVDIGFHFNRLMYLSWWRTMKINFEHEFIVCFGPCVQLALFTNRNVNAYEELTWVSTLDQYKTFCFLYILSRNIISKQFLSNSDK